MSPFKIPTEYALTSKQRWLGLLFLAVIKLLMFTFFAVQFAQNTPPQWITSGIAISNGDTSGYYGPVESFVEGEGYNSMCRMPGLLPVYAPLYALLGKDNARAAIIILQLLIHILAAWFLARLAAWLTQSDWGYYLMLALYGLSTFVSVRDHQLLTDSFATSLLIICVFTFFRGLERQSARYLLFAGVLLAWAVFFRPVSLVFYLPFGLLILGTSGYSVVRTVKPALIFGIPLILSIGVWTTVNYARSGRIIPLQAPFTECFGYLSEEHLAIRKLIISMGEDYMPWSEGSAAQWFFRRMEGEPDFHPFDPEDFTQTYNLDSLKKLRKAYLALDTVTDKASRDTAAALVARTALRYDAALRAERPAHVYVWNRLDLLRNYVLPRRLDDLPFPAYESMSWYHKLIKAGSFVLLIFVNIFGLLSWLWLFFRNPGPAVLIGLIPVLILIVLGPVLGYVEQRYLVPAYPILMLMIVTGSVSFLRMREGVRFLG